MGNSRPLIGYCFQNACLVPTGLFCCCGFYKVWITINESSTVYLFQYSSQFILSTYNLQIVVEHTVLKQRNLSYGNITTFSEIWTIMRTLLALAAVLSLASALITPYNGNEASPVHRLRPRMVPGGNRDPGSVDRGGKKGTDYGSPYDDPKGGVIHPGRGATNEQVRNVIAQQPAYNSGWDPVAPKRPAPGESGVWVDDQGQGIVLHYGDDMPYHGDGELYHQQAYPGSADRGYGTADTGQKKDQRKRALKGLPAGYGPWIHRDENRAASVAWMQDGLSRNFLYGYNPNREDTTNVPAPEGESARQSRLFAKAKELRKGAHPSYEIYLCDNRLKTASLRVQPNRGPYLPDDNDGRGHPYHTTNENPGY